jgi:hypothetical protein
MKTKTRAPIEQRPKDQALVLRDLKRKVRGLENEAQRVTKELASARRVQREFEKSNAGGRVPRKLVGKAWFVVGYSALPIDPAPTPHMLRLWGCESLESWLRQGDAHRASARSAISDPVARAIDIVRALEADEGEDES